MLLVLNLGPAKFLLAGDQPRCLPLKVVLAAGGPLLEPLLLFDQGLVLVGQQLADCLQFLFLFGQFRLGLAVLLSQLRADATERLGEGCRRRGAGEFRPRLFRREANLQRFPVHAGQFGTKLLQCRAAVVYLLGAALQGLAFLRQVGHGLLVLGDHLLAERGGLLLKCRLLLRYSLLKLFGFGLGSGKSRLRFVKSPLLRCQRLNGTTRLLFFLRGRCRSWHLPAGRR